MPSQANSAYIRRLSPKMIQRADAAHYEASKLACEHHLKALLRYGLKHDGLPGLPANDLLRLADKLGVAA